MNMHQLVNEIIEAMKADTSREIGLKTGIQWQRCLRIRNRSHIMDVQEMEKLAQAYGLSLDAQVKRQAFAAHAQINYAGQAMTVDLRTVAEVTGIPYEKLVWDLSNPKLSNVKAG